MSVGAISTTRRRSIHPAVQSISLGTQPAAATLRVGVARAPRELDGGATKRLPGTEVVSQRAGLACEHLAAIRDSAPTSFFARMSIRALVVRRSV
jgi:hypothetical protein